MMIKNMRN